MDIKQRVGKRIKNIRRRRGYTQESLAELVGIGAKYLSSIERGKENPTLKTLTKVSEVLGVDISDVFYQTEIEDPAKRKELLLLLLEEADDDQTRLAYRVLSAIIR